MSYCTNPILITAVTSEFLWRQSFFLERLLSLERTMFVWPDSKISNSTFLLYGFPWSGTGLSGLSIPFSCIYVMVLSGKLPGAARDPYWEEPAWAHVLLPGHAGPPHWPVHGLSTVHTVLGILGAQPGDWSGCLHCPNLLCSWSVLRGVWVLSPWPLIALLQSAVPKIHVYPHQYQNQQHRRGHFREEFPVINAPIVRPKFFHYCRPRILPHSFCLHQDSSGWPALTSVSIASMP